MLPHLFLKKKRIAKPRALSWSLMKYSFPINRKVLHFKRLNRMLLENSFQLVKLKNWKNSKERIFSWHLSFDFHLDKFLFAPKLVSEFCSSESEKEVLITVSDSAVLPPLPPWSAWLWWQEGRASYLLTHLQWLIVSEMLILFYSFSSFYALVASAVYFLSYHGPLSLFFEAFYCSVGGKSN